jgi:hypothetical protein
MYDTKQDLTDALGATPDILAQLLSGLLEKPGGLPPASPGEWSAVEIICHLRDAEERALERMRKMRDQKNPVIEGYDQAAWAADRNYKGDDVWKALEKFRALRGMHVDDLKKLAFEDWQRGGKHAEFGHITILAQTLHSASHDAVHLRQLARLAGTK